MKLHAPNVPAPWGDEMEDALKSRAEIMRRAGDPQARRSRWRARFRMLLVLCIVAAVVIEWFADVVFGKGS